VKVAEMAVCALVCLVIGAVLAVVLIILLGEKAKDGTYCQGHRISDCYLSEGASKNRAHILISHRFCSFSMLPSLG
jgi:hypothetical protein